MSFLGDLFGGTKKSTQTSTQTQSIAPWLEDASKASLDKAMTIADKPFESYTGDRVAGFTGDQSQGFQMLRDFLASNGKDGLGAIQKYATAGPQQISTERTVDENGRLGSISDYVNPYVEGALAPAIRKIQESADAARKRVGATAMASGSFGDARQGVREAALDRDTSMAIGETAGQMYKSAYDSAMGQRSGDLARFQDADKTNATFEETALQRALQGATAEQKQALEQIQALLAQGTAQQQNDQGKLDAAYQEFIRQYQHDPAMIQMVGNLLKGAPSSKTVTGQTVSETPDNSLMQLLGSVGGAILGGPVGGAIGSSLFGSSSTTPGTAANGGFTTTTNTPGWLSSFFSK